MDGDKPGKSRRGFIWAGLGTAVGIAASQLYEMAARLDERFPSVIRERYRADMLPYLDQIKACEDRITEIQSELSNMGSLETEYGTELKKAYEDLDATIAGAESVVNKYKPILGSDALLVEDAILGLLKKYKFERIQYQQNISGKQQQINQLNSQINSFQQQIDGLKIQLEEISKLPIFLWQSDFRYGTLDGFSKANFELGCPETITSSDVSAKVVNDPTAPSGNNNVLELTANEREMPGLNVNALTHRSIEKFEYDSVFYAFGYFKRTPSDIQNNAVNLQLVEGYTEYICLFQWILNPWDQDYGWVKLRTRNGDIRIHKIGDDNSWHYFELEGTYLNQPKRRYISRLMVDNSTYFLNEEMPTVGKGWEKSFIVILECANKWTGGCGNSVIYKGAMLWDKIGVVKRRL